MWLNPHVSCKIKVFMSNTKTRHSNHRTRRRGRHDNGRRNRTSQKRFNRHGRLAARRIGRGNLTKDLAAYENIVFGGWDLFGEHLAKAAEEHDVLTHKQFVAVEDELRQIKPWRAVENEEFLVNIRGENKVSRHNSHRETIEKISKDLQEFQKSCDDAVVINLASTEKLADEGNEIFNSIEDFEKALDDDSKEISPAMLYAYAAIAEDMPYGNFTPSVSADTPALIEFAERKGVPLAGKDGKTGQTMIKTVLAPALKTRALRVEGWYSTNILGNRDGLALSNEDSLASKVKTKGSVLDDILGYTVEDHHRRHSLLPPARRQQRSVGQHRRARLSRISRCR